MTRLEADYQRQFGERVLGAVESLFPDRPIAAAVRTSAAQFAQEVDQILDSRGIPTQLISLVGPTGQGKSWLVRQLIQSATLRSQIPSGVLRSEATSQVVWVGPVAPEQMEGGKERWVQIPSDQLAALGVPYTLLDTPGVTDADASIADRTRALLQMSPIQILVMRRDQLRSAIASRIASWIEGAICIPVITAVPPSDLVDGVCGPSLAEDLDAWSRWLRQSAEKTQWLAPILIEDFEATGDEPGAAERWRQQLRERLGGLSLDRFAQSRQSRLDAARQRYLRQVAQGMQQEVPQLLGSLRTIEREAEKLPSQVIESLLGSNAVLETAIRGRRRAQIVQDTAGIWFPYRTAISMLSLVAGAWDRLLWALTGSVPSLFGTLIAWARNLQNSRQAQQAIEQGIRQRVSQQLEDRWDPIQRQFYASLDSSLGPLSHRSPSNREGMIRLSGLEELQTRSHLAFDEQMERSKVPWSMLQLLGLIASVIFWGLMAGPIVAVYRQYIAASFHAMTDGVAKIEEFPHPSPSLFLTSGMVSLFPVFLFAMVVLTWLLRRSRLQEIGRRVLAQHHQLIDQMRSEGLLQITYDDPLLEKAQFLLRVTGAVEETGG
jgi:hypothetical protein